MLAKFRNLYGNCKMSWLKVILFAVIAGLYTGIVMLIPVLENTSFQDIGINLEWWVIFAVIIVVNCQKNWEAMLKCFIFFLISQPLVYLVEVVFGPLTTEMAIYYYRVIWFRWTIAVLPGAFIAYYCQKQNWIGAFILGCGNTLQLLLGLTYIAKCVSEFPYHGLSAIVCIASIFVMSFSIQKQKKYCIASLVIPLTITALLIVLAVLTGRLNF